MRTYLDSGVLFAAFSGDHRLHDAAFQIIDDPDRVFVKSKILDLETLPKATYQRRTEEIQFYEDFFRICEQDVSLDNDSVTFAQEIASRYGLRGLDALHLAAALLAQAEEFITTEKSTKPFFRATDQPISLKTLHSK